MDESLLVFNSDKWGAYIARWYPIVWINVYRDPQYYKYGIPQESRFAAMQAAAKTPLAYRIKVTFKGNALRSGKWSGVSQ